MKGQFDLKTVVRTFQPGDKVLALLPVPGSGPYVVEKKLNETSYVISTPHRKRK